ncbi:MAG: PTS fructose transporter subunit IIA [Pseudomonadota bacterium]
MIGLVIVAHGGLAREYLAAVEHIVGPQPMARAISIAPDDDGAGKRAEVAAALAAVDDGSGVALITDVFGSTPANLAIGACGACEVEVIYGANVPLLVKLAKSRDLPLSEAVRCALSAGRKYIDSRRVSGDAVESKERSSFSAA